MVLPTLRHVGRALAHAFVLVFLVGCFLVPRLALACDNYDVAMAKCVAAGDGKLDPSCSVRREPNTTNDWTVLTYWNYNHTASSDVYVAVICPGTEPQPPTGPEICAARPSYKGLYGDNLNSCVAGCTYAPSSGDDGPAQTCTRQLDGSMKCLSASTYKPTGATCGSGPTDTTPPVVPPPPKLCGGGSCYDPTTNTDCAVGSNGQVCIPRPKPGQPGGCVSSGNTTLCSGNPPPMPPDDQVPDPPSNISGSDQSNQQPTGPNGPYGTINNTTINNYNNGTSEGSTGANNGKGDGDVGGDPATSGSTGGNGDGTSSSGGGDCNTPPIVTGSPALQQIAYQSWATRCAVQNPGLGQGTVGNLGQLYTPSTDTVGSVVANFQGSVKETPIGKSVAGFFTVDGLGGTCPVWTLPASDWLPEQTFDFYCRPELDDALDMARLIILIVCAYAAFRIALGDS